MTETANEARMKVCSNCGKKVEKALLFKGYVFLFRSNAENRSQSHDEAMLGACTERNKKGSSASLTELIRGSVVV